MLHPRNPADASRPADQPDLKVRARAAPSPPSSTIINHDTFAREALVQRIVKRLRCCDTATLESLALILDQDRNCREA